jgi:hypothetical protein
LPAPLDANSDADTQMLLYETYFWFSRRRQGMLERERKRVCAALLAVFGLLYLHSDKAAPFQTAIARLARAILEQPADIVAFLR